MTLVIAHRGASAARPENTVEAFRHAVELGADGVELDLRCSADGELVVHHDALYPDGRAVSEVDMRDRPAGVCGLDDAIAACDGILMNLELKNTPGEPGYQSDDALADLLISLLPDPDRRKFLVSSFNLSTIDRVRHLDSEMPTAWLTFGGGLGTGDVFAIAVERGHGTIHPHDSQVSADYVDRAHAAGLKVNVWTVDDPERISELGRLGADGVVTNVPDVASRVLR